MEMVLTIFLAMIMMAGLFLLLWSVVGFIQDKRLMGSAPKEGIEAYQEKKERFKGQHVVGWLMLVVSLALMAGALLFGAYDGIQKGFGFIRFFLRFALMLGLLKAYDILFFDWYLLCRSGFFVHYHPELKEVYGPHLFGYNKRSHMIQFVLMMSGSLLAAGICTLIR